MDLFGGDTPVFTKEQVGRESKYQRYKRVNKYRRAEGKDRCGACARHMAFDYHDHTYHKCRNMGHSFGPASDIRLRDICNNFTPAEEKRPPVQLY